MNKSKLGSLYGIIIVILIALSLTLVLSAPTSTGGGLIDPAGIHAKGTISQTVYADASGWNYSHGTPNPTLYFPLDYKICFTIIEEDNLPHTFTLNKDKSYVKGTVLTKYEKPGTALTLVTTGELTEIPGHSYKKSYIFFSPGNYTYWCTVHPTTMLARIQVNGTASASTSIVSQPIGPSISGHGFKGNSNPMIVSLDHMISSSFNGARQSMDRAKTGEILVL
jgi:hypothetical protein